MLSFIYLQTFPCETKVFGLFSSFLFFSSDFSSHSMTVSIRFQKEFDVLSTGNKPWLRNAVGKDPVEETERVNIHLRDFLFCFFCRKAWDENEIMLPSQMHQDHWNIWNQKTEVERNHSKGLCFTIVSWSLCWLCSLHSCVLGDFLPHYRFFKGSLFPQAMDSEYSVSLWIWPASTVQPQTPDGNNI